MRNEVLMVLGKTLFIEYSWR